MPIPPNNRTPGQTGHTADHNDISSELTAQSGRISALEAGGGGGVADGSVTTAKLADGSVTSAKIADGTIVDADVATGAGIALSKLATTGTASESTFLRGDGSWNQPGANSLPFAANDWWLLSRGVTTAHSTNSVASTISSSNNRGMLLPFWVGATIGVDGLALGVTTGNNGADAVLRLGIYANGAGRPGTVVVDADTLSINTTGLKAMTFTEVTLTPGWYWAVLAYQGLNTADTNPAHSVGTAVATSVPEPGTGSPPVPTAGAALHAFMNILGVSGAFPNNPTVLSNRSNTAQTPHIWMRVSTP
jgi:hypothetical protein